MDAPNADTVAPALQRLLASPYFEGSPRARRFVRFVVVATLGGLGDSLKEYVLGVDAFAALPSIRAPLCRSSGCGANNRPACHPARFVVSSGPPAWKTGCPGIINRK